MVNECEWNPQAEVEKRLDQPSRFSKKLLLSLSAGKSHVAVYLVAFGGIRRLNT